MREFHVILVGYVLHRRNGGRFPAVARAGIEATDFLRESGWDRAAWAAILTCAREISQAVRRPWGGFGRLTFLSYFGRLICT